MSVQKKVKNRDFRGFLMIVIKVNDGSLPKKFLVIWGPRRTLGHHIWSNRYGGSLQSWLGSRFFNFGGRLWLDLDLYEKSKWAKWF